MNTSIIGCIEAIDQASNFLSALKEEIYRVPASPLFQSSIGQHLRHTLDLFYALREYQNDAETCDYDLRRRGTKLEYSISAARRELSDIKDWVQQIDEAELRKTMTIKSEVGLTEQLHFVGESTLARELVFVSSHLVHHMAIIVAIAKDAGLKVDPKTGVAAATATYMREVKTSA